jgi:hypothetical protein
MHHKAFTTIELMLEHREDIIWEYVSLGNGTAGTSEKRKLACSNFLDWLESETSQSQAS